MCWLKWAAGNDVRGRASGVDVGVGGARWLYMCTFLRTLMSVCVSYCWCLPGRWDRVDVLGVVFVQVGSGVFVGLFVAVANSCMYLFLDSLFLSDGFLL